MSVSSVWGPACVRSKCKYEKHERWSRARAFICVSFFRLTEASLSLYYGPCIRHSRFTVAQIIVGIGANLSSKASRQILVQHNGKWYKIPFFKKGCRTSTNADSLPECDALVTHSTVPLSRCLRDDLEDFFVSLSKGLCSLACCNTELTSVNCFCITLQKSPLVSQPIVLSNCLNRIWQEMIFT